MAGKIVSYTFRGDITDLRAKTAAAGQSVAKLGNDLTAADAKSQKLRQGLTSVGDAAGKLGLVAAAGLGAIVVATANFDKAMSNVQAATHETEKNMESLREAAIKAGADTAFSASEAAAGIENLAKAGVTTADVLNGGLNGALDLAAAGEMEVADAAEVAATAMTQFNLAGSEVPHIADLLASAAGKAQGDVSDMAMALKQSGLVASQMGLSIEETTGTLAAFASAGLLGSDAGTSFRTMLLRMANPSAEAADLMAELGIAAYDAQGSFVGIEALAGQLATAFEGQTQAQRDAAFATIFGSDAIRGASVLYQQGADGVADWTNKVDDAGYAAETAATRLDNLRGDLEALGGSLETALIGGGEGSQGMLRQLVQGVTGAVNAFNSLPPAAQGATTAVLGVTAAAGGGLWAFSKAVNAVSGIREAFTNLGPAGTKAAGALGKVGKAAGAVGAVVAAAAIADKLAKIGLEVPGLEATKDALIDLADAGASARIASDFNSIGDSVGRLVDANAFEKVGDGLLRILSLGQAEGRRKSAAVAELQGLDAALADLVNNGHADTAADALENLAKSEGWSQVEIEALLDLLPGYEEALTGVGNDAELAAKSTDDLADATASSTGATEDNTEALADNIDAMREKRSMSLEAANAEIAYEAALDRAVEALKDNGKTLDITTEKGRNNRSALYDIAGAWNDLADEQKNARGAFKDARDDLVGQAMQFGATRKEARRLADEFLEFPPLKVEADTARATREVESFADKVRRELAGIKDEPVEIGLFVREHGAAGARSAKLYGDSYGGAGAGAGGHGGPTLNMQTTASEVPTEGIRSAAAGIAAELKEKYAFGSSVLPKGAYRIGMPYLGYPGHYGADYPAAVGTPVYAAGAGTVGRAMSMAGSYGRHVYLDHPGGVQTRYAHLTNYTVSPGQMVLPGQMIGTVGSTGNSTGPHLHFEYRQGGTPINPATLGMFWGGGFTGHGGKYEPKGVVHGGEYVWDQETTSRYLPYLRDIAMGGKGDSPYDIGAQLDMLRLQQQINQLRRDLAADGKDQIKGLARAMAELELQSARRELRQARRAPFVERRAGLRDERRALRGIELDVEGGATVAETRDALREFRRDVREAGGTWTKAMGRTAHRLIDLAKASQRTERNLERETEKRDRLANKLDEQVQALEQLRDTMASFSQSVAGNFLNDPFNRGYGMAGAGGGAAAGDPLEARLALLRQRQSVDQLRDRINPTVVADPNLGANRAALADAERRLAEARANPDALSASYAASKLLPEVDALRQAVAEGEARQKEALPPSGIEMDILRTELELAERQLELMENPPASEPILTGVESLREQLIADTEAAKSFDAALRSLTDRGVDSELFKQLATSGDLEMARELADMTATELADINALWEQREEAAAQLGAYATQEVFGPQFDAMTQVVAATERVLARQDRTIERLNNRLENLGNKVENGAEQGVARALRPQIKQFQRAIENQTRQIRQLQQAGQTGRN